VIDTDEKLAALLPGIRAAAWIAVDTEADSLHAYPEKLCLIQISIAGEDELLDPLSSMEMGPLLEVLGRHELIFHGADYDLRLLRKSCGFVPSAISDTMLASRLLGYREFGLNHLVSKHLGVPLEKGPQKANWARRPLTPRMEIYARNDTHYLKPLSDLLLGQLKEKGRLGWHRETCARLVADCAQFRPSAQCDRPYAMIGVSGIAADSDAAARRLFTSPQQAFTNIVRGTRGKLRPPIDDIETYWSPAEKVQASAMLACSFVGSVDTLRESLGRFLEKTHADELMIASAIYDHAARLRSYEIFAELRKY